MDHTLVVDKEGCLFVGGSNDHGQLGIVEGLDKERPYKHVEFFDGEERRVKSA